MPALYKAIDSIAFVFLRLSQKKSIEMLFHLIQKRFVAIE
jgi:hypothetical protein